MYTFELTPLYATFLNSAKLSGYRTEIKFDNSALVEEQNNYASKNVNVYIVYDLHTWSKNPLKNFALKNWLFGASNIVKNNVEEKFVYSGYEIASDGAGEWSSNNKFDKNVMIFGVDNSSSSHTDNQKNDFLALGERPTYGIYRSFGAPRKKFSINLSKAKAKFCLSLYYNGDNSYLFVNGKEIYKFKASNKNVNFPFFRKHMK